MKPKKGCGVLRKRVNPCNGRRAVPGIVRVILAFLFESGDARIMISNIIHRGGAPAPYLGTTAIVWCILITINNI